MKLIEAKNCLEFHPQGDRFNYHTADDASVEAETLKNILDFCDKLAASLANIFANAKLGNPWWTKALILQGDDQGRVTIDEIRTKANLMLANAALTRGKLKQVKADFPDGIMLYGSMDPFPPEDMNPAGPANEGLVGFTVELTELAVREYYIGEDGMKHCKGLLPVYMNDKPLLLTDGDFVDGAVEVVYAADFIARP